MAGGQVRILGVDPGTRVVGYSLIESDGPGRFRYLECGVLRSNHDSVLDRILEISTELRDLIDQGGPQEMAIESAFHGQNAYSALTLGESRGAYKLVAAQCGLSVFEYAPAKVKRAVTGAGRATKALVQQRVALLCGLQRPPPHDAADAVALAICHAHLRSDLALHETGLS